MSVSIECIETPPASDSKNRREQRQRSGWPRGDIDNLTKAILDAITGVGVWLDDSQVVELGCRKGYGDEAITRVTICAG